MSNCKDGVATNKVVWKERGLVFDMLILRSLLYIQVERFPISILPFFLKFV